MKDSLETNFLHTFRYLNNHKSYKFAFFFTVKAEMFIH